MKQYFEADWQKLLQHVEALAVTISQEIILPDYLSTQAKIKSDGSLVTDADICAHAELSEQLVKLADIPVLSEEMSEAQQQEIFQAESSHYWCIDPIDGTSNFVYGIPYWCISIALIIDGQLKLGVVYDPNRKECFAAVGNNPTTVNGLALPNNYKRPITELNDCIGMIDFKRLPSAVAQSLACDPPYRSQRSFGASALDLCWIAAQRCHLYLHGKQKIWDHAAGLKILVNAGAQAQTFDGDTVFKQNLQAKSVLAASSKLLMRKWQTYFQKIYQKDHEEKT